MDAARRDALLLSALARSPGDHTLADVREQLRTRQATLFEGERSVLVCTLHETPDGAREGHGWLGAGDLSELIGPVRRQAEAWARANGARFATLDARPGWARVLKRLGYADGDELRKAI